MNINNKFFTEFTNRQYENADISISREVKLEDQALVGKLIKHIQQNNNDTGMRWLGKHAGKEIAWIHWLHKNYFLFVRMDPAFREHWPLFHTHATVKLASNTLFSTREYLTIKNREFNISGHSNHSMLTEFYLFLKQTQNTDAVTNIKDLLGILEYGMGMTIPAILEADCTWMCDAIKSNQIILCPVGWQGHTVYLVFFHIANKSYLSICNRGQGAPKKPANLYQTIKTIEINKNKISEKIFNKLFELTPDTYKKGKHFIYNELPKLLSDKPTPPADTTIMQLNSICPPLQKSRNCTYSSLMCSMRPMLFSCLSALERENAIQETETIAKYLSDSFSCASGERYYKLFNNSINEFLPEGPSALDISKPLQKKKDRLTKLLPNVQKITF